MGPLNLLTLFLFRCWAPDRTLSQARKYIEETLGKKYADGVVLDLHKTWSESDVKNTFDLLSVNGFGPNQ